MRNNSQPPPPEDPEPAPVPIADAWWPLGDPVPITLDDDLSRAQQAKARRRAAAQREPGP